jgi:putative hydrolase of the HAD superfamily
VTNSSKTTVLLDAGGVLLDESDLEEYLCEEIVAIVVSTDHFYSSDHYWRDTHEAIMRFCPSTPRCVLWKRCDGDTELYRLWIEQYADTSVRRPSPRLCPEMIDVIPHLAERFRIVLAGQYGAEIYHLLAPHGLDSCFSNRLSQDDFSVTKPDPRYLAQIARASGVQPEECIMVGDRIDKDVIPAKLNGMGTVFVRTGIYRSQAPRTPEEAPDITIDNLGGLAAAICEGFAPAGDGAERKKHRERIDDG